MGSPHPLLHMGGHPPLCSNETKGSGIPARSFAAHPPGAQLPRLIAGGFMLPVGGGGVSGGPAHVNEGGAYA